MKTLLVPVDFSDTTPNLLAYAADFARQISGRLVLLHVSEPVATYIPVGASMDILAAAPPPMEYEDTAAQDTRLTEEAKPLRAMGLEVECITIMGMAVDEILEQSKSFAADFVLLGSHGHGALYHLFSGSVVTGVLKRATCPVLVIPAVKETK